jgi:two-component system, LytTR family, response regulator
MKAPAAVARVLIVDDEAPARRKLARFLGDDARFVVAGEAEDGAQAVEQIVALEPDLIFLDIQMPGLDGFEVLAALPRESLPHVVFTTAFAEFALKAFEVRAVDYLLKPFDQERFQAACETYWERRGEPSQLARLIESLRASPGPLERLLVRQRERLVIVRLRDVTHVSAEEHYVRLHVSGGSHLHRMALSDLAARLDRARFIRVQRSEIVNVDHIASLEPAGHGDAVVHLRDGTEVVASRHYRREWGRRLGA